MQNPEQKAAREAALRHWALQAGQSIVGRSQSGAEGWQMVAGDASFRRYFRLTLGQNSFIVMDAPPPQEEVHTFIRVAGLMSAGGLRVPAIQAADAGQGFLLLEDFGDRLVRDELDPDRGQAMFDWILPTLGQLAACDADALPHFDARAMQTELDLFADWYLGRHCELELDAGGRRAWQTFCDLLIDEALEQPQRFVHRDFHSCNLLRVDQGAPGLIDFQDAVLGPASYDLASWLWDRYISWPRSSLEAWMEQARPLLAPLIECSHWQKCCDWMGLQRNIKVVGIFSRLNYRDGKQEYLQLMPRFADYIRNVLPRYPAFNEIQPNMLEWLAPCGRA